MLGTVMTTHSHLSFATYIQTISLQSLQKISAYGQHPSVFGITSQANMLYLMTVLKKLAFQNGIREAFIISAIITVISLISSLFIGKKQSRLVPKKSML